MPDALWAYRTTYKTPIGMSPYQIVYGETCHLPIELEHRAHWAIWKWKMDLKQAGEHRMRQISELEEWRDKAYHNVSIYKERTKRWHDKRLKLKIFNPGCCFQLQGEIVWSWKASQQMVVAVLHRQCLIIWSDNDTRR